MISNLQDLVPQQAPASSLHQNNWNFSDNSFWYDYRDFEALNNFTETMVSKFPKLVKRVSIGNTYEGREVFGLSIHGFKAKKKGKGNEDATIVDDDSDYDNKYNYNDDESDYDDDIYDDDEDDDDGEYTLDKEETLLDKFESWWSWLFGSSRQFGKPSKPKKHPKAIVIHAGQHARGINLIASLQVLYARNVASNTNHSCRSFPGRMDRARCGHLHC